MPTAAWIDKFLPPMQCDAGCGACCGPAPCSQAEFDSVTAHAKARGIQPQRQGAACPFYQGGTCAVYEARPSVCRLFGHVSALECCKGYNVNVSPTIERHILLTVHGKVTRRPLRIIHECVYSWAELNDIIDDQFAAGEPRVVKPKDPRIYELARMLAQMGRNRRPLLCVDPEAREVDFAPAARQQAVARRAAAGLPRSGG